jgi:non-specific serine/threonine protein kinase
MLNDCADLADAVLHACPGVQMLATSRQPLGIGGESVLRLPPLSLPAREGSLPPVERLLEYEAVSLFLVRVRAARPGFALTTQNAPAVLQICRRLDGLPLAIELAAARVGVLAVEAIAARLDDRFRLLAGGSRAVPRQQTLRATMDWSYNLLSGAEQTLLCRLSVFAGGWTLEAAEAITDGDGVEANEMLDLLGALVGKSLVQTIEHDGATRYGLLETVRAYARDHLCAQDREESARARHASWYGELARTAGTHLQGPTQRDWLARLERDHENLRAALTWALEIGAQEEGLRLAGSLAFFWSIRGHLSEGRRWLAQFLALGNDASPLVRARAARDAGMLATYQGDHAQAAAWLAESLTLCRIHGDRPGIISTLQKQADLTYRYGDYAGAEALFAECLVLAREEGDQRAIALTLNGLANVANERGEYAQAAARYQGALATLRALDDERATTVVLNNLGNVAYAQEDFAGAAALHEENATVRRALGDRLALATTLGNLGKARKAQGDHARARIAYEESLALARAVDAPRTIAGTLTYLTELCLDQGDLDGAAVHAAEALTLFGALGDKAGILAALQCRASAIIARMDQKGDTDRDALILAVQLLAAVAAHRAALGITLMPPDRPGLERHLAAARGLLDGETFSTAWTAGAAISIGEAFALAQRHGLAPAPEGGPP